MFLMGICGGLGGNMFCCVEMCPPSADHVRGVVFLLGIILRKRNDVNVACVGLCAHSCSLCDNVGEEHESVLLFPCSSLSPRPSLTSREHMLLSSVHTKAFHFFLDADCVRTLRCGSPGPLGPLQGVASFLLFVQLFSEGPERSILEPPGCSGEVT